MTLSGARMVVLDSETTGLDPAAGHAAFEIAINSLDRNEWFASLIDPGRDVPCEVSGITNVTTRDLVGQPTIDDIRLPVVNFVRDVDLVFAHNAEFDKQFFPWLNSLRWVCSMRLAQHLLPDAPNYKVNTLRYYLDELSGTTEGADLEVGDTHRAVADVTITAFVVRKLVEIYLASGRPDDIDAFVAFVESPIWVKKMPLGKYRGADISTVTDFRYLLWMTSVGGISDLRSDLRWTIEIRMMQIVDACESRGLLREWGTDRYITESLKQRLRDRWVELSGRAA